MAFLSFYSTRRPRQYNHKPIYWDPRREALDDRVLKIKKEMGLVESDEEYKSHIKGSFVEGTTHLKKRIENGETPKGRVYTNMKLAVALVLLLVLLWFMFIK